MTIKPLLNSNSDSDIAQKLRGNFHGMLSNLIGPIRSPSNSEERFLESDLRERLSLAHRKATARRR
jgi:hypothetical protein